MKSKFKFLIIFVLLIILSSSCFCLASNNNDIMLISSNPEPTENKKNIRSDLCITDKKYELNNFVEGNVYASVDILNISPKDNGEIITGNIYATANIVNIKSDVSYSENEKDELGNPLISVNTASSIHGNVFVLADKFVLEPGSKINGDLYVCANEITLDQNSVIGGNVFVLSSYLNLNSQIEGDLYANVKTFEMKYYGSVRRDLHLTSNNATINGYINRNSFITSDNIVLENKFINEENFNVENSNNIVLCGEINGNANINCKKINFDNDKANFIIRGNLNYSSNDQLNIKDGIVLKEINYNKYKNNRLSNILNFILPLLTTLSFVYVIYLLINKFSPNLIKTLDNNITCKNLLKTFGISLGFFILIPIISILLFISNIGSLLGLLVILIYILLLLMLKPLFIIGIAASLIKNKESSKLNIYLYMLGITVIFSLINLIPYVGAIFSVLVSFISFGFIIKNISIKK